MNMYKKTMCNIRPDAKTLKWIIFLKMVFGQKFLFAISASGQGP